MADDHIDYLECLEYGEHLVKEVPALAGKTPLVDITALVAYLSTSMTAVANELEKQGIKRSSVRLDRQEVSSKSAAVRKHLEKFHHFLESLDEDQGYDVPAFFPGGNRGPLSTLKPADLNQFAALVLRGFAAPANTNLPDGAKWKTRIETAQSDLAVAIGEKSASTGKTILATAALVDAREAFLVAYNGVAKRLVLAVLIKLDRKDELRLFFKDLQVNEGSTPAPAPAPAAASTGG